MYRVVCLNTKTNDQKLSGIVLNADYVKAENG